MSTVREEYGVDGSQPNGKSPSDNLPFSGHLPEPLSWDELLKPVDLTDNLLGNRFLERGQGFIMFGPAGCGKSVAALQACAEWSAGQDGLHVRPARPLKIVVLQTEDSINDLRENFAGIFGSSCFDSAAQRLVRENLIVLNPVPGGNEQDLQRHLDEIGQRFKPDLVCANPLLAFVSGDPSRELGGLLYQIIDPVIKKWGFGLLAVHHTTKSNLRDTSGYGAHDWQYLAAGDARVANWPRAMIQIEPVADGVYRFRAAKRGNRAGWTWNLKSVTERYFRWATSSVRWEDAMPEDVQRAQTEEPYQRVLVFLPEPDQEGISRERLIERAKQGRISKNKVEGWLKLCLEDKLVDRYDVPTASKRKAALFRRKAQV